MEEVKRVYGPYKQTNGTYRVVVIRAATGKRESHVYADRTKALRAVEKFQPRRADTVRQGIDEFLLHLRLERGNKQSSIRNWRDVLLGILHPIGGASLAELTTTRAQHVFKDKLSTGDWKSPTTVLNSLSKVRQWGAWLVKTGRAKTNPWTEVEYYGRRRRGKKQLHVDEVVALVARCTQERSRDSVAVLCCLFLGLRASEVASLTVRDVDAGASIVWVEDSKTEAGKRTVGVPELLRPMLSELTVGKGRQDRLFGVYDRKRLWKQVKRLCAEVGVPGVCPHSLRGSHGTLAIVNGKTAEDVAASLGHTNTRVTRDHYIDPEQEKAALLRRLAELVGKDQGSSFPAGLPGEQKPVCAA